MSIRAYKLAISAAHGVEPRWVEVQGHLNDEQDLARLGAGRYRIYTPTHAVVKGGADAVNDTPMGWHFDREVELGVEEPAPKASFKTVKTS